MKPSQPPAAPATEAPARRLRVLQVLGYAGAAGHRYGITGVERVVQLLLEGLDRDRFEHYVAYPEAGAMLEAFRPFSRACLVAIPERRLDLGYARELVRFARDYEVDIVVSHGLRYDFHVALACLRLRLRHVVVRAVALADEPMPAGRKLAFGLMDAWSLGRCTSIVAVSEASKRRMVRTQRIPAAKITVIPNGVDVPKVPDGERRLARQALGAGPDDLIVGGAGQLIRRKSFDVLVEALGRLRGRHTNLVGVILGEGPERARLETLARQRGVRLLLPGYVEDPFATMAAFDIAVLPSRAEGMPLVVLECMALGVANVATPAAGTAEVIEDGISGLLVPWGDAVALAEATERLLREPELRARIAAAGRRRATEAYSLAAMLRRFAAHLEHLARRSAA